MAEEFQEDVYEKSSMGEKTITTFMLRRVTFSIIWHILFQNGLGSERENLDRLATL